jgi:hypothetical protein
MIGIKINTKFFTQNCLINKIPKSDQFVMEHSVNMAIQCMDSPFNAPMINKAWKLQKDTVKLFFETISQLQNEYTTFMWHGKV